MFKLQIRSIDIYIYIQIYIYILCLLYTHTHAFATYFFIPSIHLRLRLRLRPPDLCFWPQKVPGGVSFRLNINCKYKTEHFTVFWFFVSQRQRALLPPRNSNPKQTKKHIQYGHTLSTTSSHRPQREIEMIPQLLLPRYVFLKLLSNNGPHHFNQILRHQPEVFLQVRQQAFQAGLPHWSWMVMM